MLDPAEKALVEEALNLLDNALAKLGSVSQNSHVKLAVKILESGVSVAEMLIGV